jgi:DNA-binding protein YbaB
MTDTTGPASGVLARLSAVRGRGSAADGLVSVEVDGTSDIVELVIEPRAMRLPSVDLAAAIREAFRSARGAAQEALATAGQEQATAIADPDQLRSTLDDIQFDAERRLSELTSIAQDLSNRLDRMA